MNGELANFQQFLTGQPENISPEEALDMWRTSHPVEDDAEEAVADLREALAEMEAGDTGTPFADFNRDFRTRHGLAS